MYLQLVFLSRGAIKPSVRDFVSTFQITWSETKSNMNVVTSLLSMESLIQSIQPEICLVFNRDVCSTLITQVCNLDMGHWTAALQPRPIRPLSTSLNHQNAIQMNNFQELKDINHLYSQTLSSSMEFLLYDCSALRAIRLTAMNILDSHIAKSTPLHASPPNN